MTQSPVRMIINGAVQESQLRAAAGPLIDPPLVSCLMVTGARPERAKLAVECFTRQTYGPRELVIIDDGTSDVLAGHVAELGDQRVRMVRLPPSDLSLGQLRNIAVEHSDGDLVCQWDDDDLSDPDRLREQVGLLLELDLDACFLERWTMVWTDGPRGGIGTRRLWEGSMLARRESLPPYPHLRRGEDSPVAEELAAKGRVALLDRPELYVYFVHGGNTFPQSHFDAHWAAASERFADPLAEIRRLQIRVPIQEALAIAGDENVT